MHCQSFSGLHVPLVQAGALPEEFVGADVGACGRRRWPTVAGRRGHNSGLAAPTSDCSVHLNGDIKEDIEINWDGTGHVLRTRG
uniref:Uncharacterized protein n=1 Tax=Aegilops tauschii subsp. strangulata TaxID=200361 RepID=A0A453Q9C1_AEGTS